MPAPNETGSESSSPPPFSSDTGLRHVVIVGGGLSGLAAAVDLSAAGARVTLLEASARLGGRVRSEQLPAPAPQDAPAADVGATWCHGTAAHGNAAHAIGLAAGVVADVEDDADDTDSEKEEEEGGERIVTVSDEMRYFSSLLYRDAAVVAPSGAVAHRRPHSAALGAVRTFNAAVVVIPSQPTALSDAFHAVRTHHSHGDGNGDGNGDGDTTARADARAAAAGRAAFEATLNGAAEEHVCALRMHEYAVVGGPDVPAGAGGMTGVVAELSRRLGSNVAVELRAEVVRVEWAARDEQRQQKSAVGSGVLVRTRDGRDFGADAVVWTPSVNVTAHAVAADVFQPPLPAWKTGALAHRGMDAVEKVFAVLVTPLRGVAARDWAVLWEDAPGIPHTDALEEIHEEEEEEEEEEEDEGKSERTWVRQWMRGVHWLEWDDARQSVVFWLVGRPARQFCSLSPGARVSQTAALLRALLSPSPAVAEVEVATVQCGEWWSNPFVRGGYSFGRFVGADEQARKDGAAAVQRLSEPLPRGATIPRLCFAGEATHAQFYSTMHGAVESGRREARRLAKALGLERDNNM